VPLALHTPTDVHTGRSDPTDAGPVPQWELVMTTMLAEQDLEDRKDTPRSFRNVVQGVLDINGRQDALKTTNINLKGILSRSCGLENFNISPPKH